MFNKSPCGQARPRIPRRPVVSVVCGVVVMAWFPSAMLAGCFHRPCGCLLA
jgi:hypothetical protein